MNRDQLYWLRIETIKAIDASWAEIRGDKAQAELHVFEVEVFCRIHEACCRELAILDAQQPQMFTEQKVLAAIDVLRQHAKDHPTLSTYLSVPIGSLELLFGKGGAS